MRTVTFNGHVFRMPEKAERSDVKGKFDRRKGVEKFLPDALMRFVLAVAHYFRTSPEMVFTGLLTALSVPLMGNFKVKAREGWLQDLVLYSMTVAKSGQNKSSVLECLIQPLRKNFEKNAFLLHDLYEQEKARCKILEERLKRAKKDAINDQNDGMDFAGVFAKQKELEEAEARLKAAKPMMFTADDVTTEKLAEILSDNHEKLVIATSEGGFLQVVSGIYSKGDSNIDLLLKAYNGEEFSQHRISRSSVTLKHPLLTLLLYVQHSVMEKALGNEDFVGRGLMARFLIALPESTVGKRNFMVDTEMYEDKEYVSLIDRLMDIYFKCLNNEAKVISYSETAEMRLREFQCLIEQNMHGELDDVKEFCSKIAGISARIAAIIHACNIVLESMGLKKSCDELIDKIVKTNISESTADAAIEIALYYVGEARYIYNLFGLEADTAEAYVGKVANRLREACQNHNQEIKKEEHENGLCWVNKRGIERIFHAPQKTPKNERVFHALESLVSDGKLAQEENVYYLNPIFFNPSADDTAEEFHESEYAEMPEMCLINDETIIVPEDEQEEVYVSPEEYMKLFAS